MDDESPVPGSWGRVFQTLPNHGRRAVRTLRLGGLCVAALVPTLAVQGCRSAAPAGPDRIPNNWFGRASIAVAPAVNLSGSRDFDPNRVADLMAVELAYVRGIRVIPVSRVLGVLAAQGTTEIESPVHAAEVARWVGADAILVFAITEYDPYDPPRVGLTAQLFGADVRDSTGADGAGGASGAGNAALPVGGSEQVSVLAETQRIFDASHAAVTGEIQQFAKHRIADDSPYGWRKYVVTQEGFMEFCCHATVSALARRPALTALSSTQGP